jgi:hypothetical protein
MNRPDLSLAMSPGERPASDGPLARLRDALRTAPGPVAEIEVGTALSIELGRQRPQASCGGCAIPLSFEGIPARTNPRLREEFRLHLAPAASGAA